MIRVVKAEDLQVGDMFEIANNLVEVIEVDELEDRRIELVLNIILSDSVRYSGIRMSCYRRLEFTILGTIKEHNAEADQTALIPDPELLRGFRSYLDSMSGREGGFPVRTNSLQSGPS